LADNERRPGQIRLTHPGFRHESRPIEGANSKFFAPGAIAQAVGSAAQPSSGFVQTRRPVVAAGGFDGTFGVGKLQGD